MPAAMVVNNGGPEIEAKTTIYVVLSATMAAFGGLMFGYDNGISGGVTAMDDFLKEFFPSVLVKKQRVQENNYCKYADERLQLFTSSLYLAALFFSFVASHVCSSYGRRLTMRLASVFFLIGSILDAFALNVEMLIIGRILLGAGVGFANQAVPLFLSEIAPPKIRGSLNVLFQLCVTIGILVANLVNYALENVHPYGWRIALGFAAVPGIMLCVGSLVITETPTSLVEREKFEEARATLMKIRDTANVDTEFDQIVHACELARQVKDPYRKLMKRSSRPPLVIAIILQVFQQFTGINAVMFYAPVLFQTMGFKNNGSLLSAVITGLVNVFSTMISVYLVDRAGRRILLLQSVVQMFISQGLIGIILLMHLKPTGSLGHTEAVIVVILVCTFVMSFAWSWGPLGWLIPSETFPLETRTAGFSFAVSANMLMTFLVAQSFLSMLCTMQAGIFFFFAAWIVIMGVFALYLLPETKGIPVDDMVERVWKQHWYWKRYMTDDDPDEDLKQTKLEMAASTSRN
ncbi:hypothetical protein NE237_012459 [Protea cynaroides]|uniref:Major facilitator superfamily (MFS) profile domain-containing protein n=1 Tax=Protea cynaroides TaxID=273540 RepID=A0A9Q0GZ62_9MAGN|nr:hypothetical protein NE237_012459 [Protea cynaroides]